MKRVAVFGDNCLDHYFVGRVSGVSAEAPVPVVKITRELVLEGMSGNVAKLLNGLGDVEVIHCVPEGLPIKNRLMTEDGMQLARWDVADTCTPYQSHQLGSCSADAIIVSDYGKGSIDSYTVGRLRSYAEAGIPLFIDTKGDPFTWLGVPCTLFPNQYEYAQWRSHYDWMPSVVLKQSSAGMSYLRYGETLLSLPALATSVRNVCGAGDAVLAAFTWAAVHSYDITEALGIANWCAAQLVSQPFDNRSISIQGILNAPDLHPSLHDSENTPTPLRSLESIQSSNSVECRGGALGTGSSIPSTESEVGV